MMLSGIKWYQLVSLGVAWYEVVSQSGLGEGKKNPAYGGTLNSEVG
jgi:hypothetical protein